MAYLYQALVDDFEDGDYTEWTVVDSSGGSISVQSTVAKSGTYALAMTTNGVNDNSNIIVSRPITSTLEDGNEFSCWVMVTNAGFRQCGTLWLNDSVSGAWVIIEFGAGDILYNGDNIVAGTLVSGASANTWYKFVITWHPTSVDFRVEDEAGNILGQVTGVNAATSYSFDEVRLRTQDDSTITGSYTAYFDDVVYGYENTPIFRIGAGFQSITKRSFVGRYPNNPTIAVAGRWDWIQTIERDDGINYCYNSIYDGTYYNSVLHFGNNHLDLTENDLVTLTDDQIINCIKTIDGVKYATIWHRLTGCRLYLSDSYKSFTDYGLIYEPTALPWCTGQILHPHYLVIDGIYYHNAVDADDHIAGLMFGEYIHEINSYGDFMSAQAAWESGSITNVHIFVIDGEMIIYYSAGVSGSDRDIGIRWAKYFDEINTNYRDQATMTAGVQAWEGDYINIGELDFDSKLIHYFGYSTEDDGLYTFDYYDLLQPSDSKFAILTQNGVIQA